MAKSPDWNVTLAAWTPVSPWVERSAVPEAPKELGTTKSSEEAGALRQKDLAAEKTLRLREGGSSWDLGGEELGIVRVASRRGEALGEGRTVSQEEGWHPRDWGRSSD
ncbi:MAG TPA: hypothetical protein VGH90_08645 [Chthoniobacteraceae bacterium]